MDLEKLKKNERAWDYEYELFIGWCALPSWGPFEIGSDDPTLLGDVRDKTILEIGCGSGHSLNHLEQKGVKKAYGIDFSSKQITLAETLNKEAIQQDRIQLWHAPMEKPLAISQIDAVFSIYAIGWTLDPRQTFANIFSYLKPGGTFTWSWDHPLLCVSVFDGTISVNDSYHSEKEKNLKNWGVGDGAFMTNRKISTWFRLLREAGFVINRFLEPLPINIDEDIARRSKGLSDFYDKNMVSKIPASFIFECQKPTSAI